MCRLMLGSSVDRGVANLHLSRKFNDVEVGDLNLGRLYWKM